MSTAFRTISRLEKKVKIQKRHLQASQNFNFYELELESYAPYRPIRNQYKILKLPDLSKLPTYIYSQRRYFSCQWIKSDK